MKQTVDKAQDILRAAVQVIAAEGYHGAKISRIAEAAGVSTGAVYLYYANKESLLHAILEGLWQRLSAELQQLLGLSGLTPSEKLDGVIDLFFDLFAENPALAQVFTNEQSLLLQQGTGAFLPHYRAFIENARALFEQGVEQDRFNPGLDLKVLHHFILGGLRDVVHHWTQDPEGFPLGQARRAVKHFVKYGLLRAS